MHPYQDLGGRSTPFHNKEFYQELIDFEIVSHLTSQVGLHIKNHGLTPVTNIKITAKLLKQDDLIVHDEASYPVTPRFNTRLDFSRAMHNSTLTVTEFPQEYEISIEIDRLLPGDEYWTADQMYIGGRTNSDLQLDVILLADQVSQPISHKLHIKINTQAQTRTLSEWIGLAESYK